MKSKHMIVGLAVMLAFLSIAPVMAAGPDDEEPREKRWRVQAGWVHEWGRHMDVRGPAPALYKDLVPESGSRWKGAPPPEAMMGPESGLPTVWNYDDGYVFPDEQSDVDPGTEVNRKTHYWHYQNPGQYDRTTDPARPTVTFHRDLGHHYDGAPRYSTGPGLDDELPSDGIEFKVMRWLKTWKKYNTDMDLVLGVAWFPSTDPLRHSRATQQNIVHRVTSYQYLDYFGSAEGGSWQPGLDYWYPFYGQYRTNDDPPGDNPIIPLDYVASPEHSGGIITDTVSIEAEIWRLRGAIGPTFTKPITRKLTGYFAPQFALEYVDVEVDRTETVTVNQNGSISKVGGSSQDEHETEFVPGVLLTAGANYMVRTNWFVGASLGWEWMSKDVEVKVGPDTVSFDLDGGEFNLTVSRKF